MNSILDENLPVFPKFEKKGNGYYTILRKKHNDGCWYLIPHLSNNLETLIDDVYRSILYIIVYPEAKDVHDQPIHIKDEFQGDEKERLFILSSELTHK